MKRFLVSVACISLFCGLLSGCTNVTSSKLESVRTEAYISGYNVGYAQGREDAIGEAEQILDAALEIQSAVDANLFPETPEPTPEPTPESTPKPTQKPTTSPTEKPTEKPTPRPTAKPTPRPTPKPTPTQKIETIVYITKTGSKYHRDGCQYLHSSKIAIELSKAQSRGYTACSKCW